MTRWPRLAHARIGSVRYLNARPLIYCFDGPVVVEHPSLLAEQLRAGLLDVALAPIYDGLTSTDYLFVDGVAIGSDGPVFSVVLAYQGDLHAIRSVAVDPASVTSVRLLQIVLAEFHQLRPVFVPWGGDSLAIDPTAARLLIGNQAIEFRRAHSLDCQFLDLGEEWQRTIGLPFVYAVWMMPRTIEHGTEIAEELRDLKDAGLSRLDEIIDNSADFDRAFRRRYLSHHIRYRLGPAEKAGIEAFRRLLVQHRFRISPDPPEYM